MNKNCTGTKTAAVIFLLLAAAMVPASGVLDDTGLETSDESDAIAPLAILVAGAAIGFVAGLVFSSDSSSSPSLSETYTSQVNATLYKDWLDTQLNAVGNGVNIDTQTLAFTQMYWSRSAEVVASSLWSEGSSVAQYYDQILTDSTFTPNIENLYRSWESLMDQPFDAMASWPSDSQSKGYGVTYGFYAGDTTVTVSKSLRYDAGTYVAPATGANRVYLASAGSDSTEGLSTLYVLGSYGILTDDNGNTYNLTKGTYDISEFTPGYYTLQGGPFVGPFTPAGNNAAELHGAFVQIADGNVHVIHADSGTIYYDDETVSDFGVMASYEANGTQTLTSSVAKTLSNWDSLITQIQTLATRTLSSAAAEWLVFDSVGSANSMTSLVMYMPDLDNLDLTAEQKYLVGLLAMQQNYEWYTGSSMQLNSSDVSVTAESLQLYVKGTIKDISGNVIAENAVYTPVGWTKDVQLTSGATTTWNQQGFTIVWSTDADNWDGTADLSTMSLVTLTPSMTLDVDTVLSNGVEVPSMVLQVKDIDLVLSNFTVTPLPPVPEDEHPYAQIIMVALIVLGLLCLAFSIRSFSPVGLILGITLIALGWFCSETLSDIITGDFSIWDHLNPFGGLF